MVSSVRSPSPGFRKGPTIQSSRMRRVRDRRFSTDLICNHVNRGVIGKDYDRARTRVWVSRSMAMLLYEAWPVDVLLVMGSVAKLTRSR